LADLFSSMIVWRGLVVASTPADRDHPYGHGKAEPIAAAMVATLLLLAAIWIVWSSAREVWLPHLAPAPFTLAVLVGVVIIKESLFRWAWREGTTIRSTAVRSDAWHHRSDAITSLAAGVGISIALIGGPRYAMADDLAALVAASVIAWNGGRLLRTAIGELMDTAPEPNLVNSVRQMAAGVTGVVRVEQCRARKMGGQYYFDMHIEVDGAMPVRRAHDIAHQVKDAVRRTFPSVADVLVHMEPAGAGETPSSPPSTFLARDDG